MVLGWENNLNKKLFLLPYIYQKVTLTEIRLEWCEFIIVVTVDFLIYIWPFVLFQICKIISYLWSLFNDKINHNKLYNNFLIRWMIKYNFKINNDNKIRTDGCIF
jgi:hypothetical protein